MQLLKAVAFKALDWVHLARGGSSRAAQQHSVAEDFGGNLANTISEHRDPESAWPPKPFEPIIENALDSEGRWVGETVGC